MSKRDRALLEELRRIVSDEVGRVVRHEVSRALMIQEVEIAGYEDDQKDEPEDEQVVHA